jgi:hypothetical protein
MFLLAFLLAIVLPGTVAGQSLDFERDVQPIFRQACGQCHTGDASMGKLRLDSVSAILRGGASGPAVLPGKSSESLLIKRILGATDAPRMPLGMKALSRDQISLIARWIDKADFSKAPTGAPADSPLITSTANSTVFAANVRPILAARCYTCHGPGVQQNGLRLDSLAAILKGGDSGKVVTPGNSSGSVLVRRLQAEEIPRMPYGGPALSTSEVRIIRQWIDSGAPGPDSTAPLSLTGSPSKHWAYIAPVRPAVPPVKDSAWPRNPIDSFVLGRLEKEGLHPSPEASKSTLLRRVYLDLIGLPPSPQELQAFLADKSPNAYEKVVDRLLASSHYGERWARPWLDLARYADSNGYEKDSMRTAWEYRDWVIRALNADMSFREFTIEQIAGDMLPHPTQDQLIATGFNRNSMLNQEGGVDPEEYYWMSEVDRVDTTASVWLGTTLGCAQCHNHKFDPFTQKDYYRFLAFFNDEVYTTKGKGWAAEPEIELPTKDQEAQSTRLHARLEELKQILNQQTPDLDRAQQSWEAEMRDAESQWTPIDPATFKSSGGADLKRLDDHSLLAGGKNPEADTYIIDARTDMPAIRGLRLEVLPDESLPKGGPGRDPDGNFFLSNLDIEIAPVDRPNAWQKVAWKQAQADEFQPGYSVTSLLPAKETPGRKNVEVALIGGWAIQTGDEGSATTRFRRQAVLVPDQPFGFSGGTLLRITLKHNMRHASRNLGRFRFSVTSESDPKLIVEMPARLHPLLAVPAASRTDAQNKQIAASYRAVSPILDPARKEMTTVENRIARLNIVTALVMKDRDVNIRPTAYIRDRGTFSNQGEQVSANVPAMLNPLPKDELPNRLALARWLVSDENPLTARVTVNRFWEALFGHGIVETSEDFGTQGDPPTHPELLDWLATEFTQNGWDMKKLLRVIVTSATYRQSSHVSPGLLARDPYNKLYARGPRFRVEAEMVHDIALGDSGLLSSKMYGPSVFPYQPEGIWNIPYSKDRWMESTGDDRYRRSIYTFVRRSAPYPSLTTYDAPSREFCTIRRVRTNTPLQALTSLNDPFFFDAARAMGQRIARDGGASESSRMDYAFQLAVSRDPSPNERERLLSFYHRQLNEGASGQMAWTMVANVLLNLDESITKE